MVCLKKNSIKSATQWLYFFTLYLLMPSANNIKITVWTQIRPYWRSEMLFKAHCRLMDRRQTSEDHKSSPWAHAGLQIFFKSGGPKWPIEQKMVGHFLKWWAQAYQTNHSWHLGCILNLHTDTKNCMHICKLTADYTVKPVSKKMTNYRLMQVKSIAECSILQYFRPSLSYHLLFRSLFCLLWVAA